MKTKDMILVALFAALTAIGAYLVIPTQPVPFTLQILFCMYAGILLGAKLGAGSQIVYVLLGLLGLPVFAGGAGGIGHIVSPTFGYLIGFIVCAYILGALSQRMDDYKGVKNIAKLFGITVIGLAAVYAIGVTYMYFIFNNYLGNDITFTTALQWGFIPFIAQDLVKCVIVAVSGSKIIPAIKRTGYLG